jgi:phosphate transport system substrate-binding protein
VKGSDTFVLLAQKWAEVYMAAHADTRIQVIGGGSGIGFAALQNQTTDLANASRKIKTEEVAGCLKAFGKKPTEYKVCLDGLAIYVNADNPVRELCLDQLAGIFTGRIKNWSEVGGQDARIRLYSRENSSGSYEFFKEQVLRGRDFAASVQTLQGTALVIESVAQDKNGIGYGGAAYGVGATALAIRRTPSAAAIKPNERTVMDGTYPIWRFLYIYVNPAIDTGEVAEYLKWIRGDEGQKVVQDNGYYPLPAK